MAAKTDFAPYEWKSLLQSPVIAGAAVSVADPSVLFGMRKKAWRARVPCSKRETDPSADALVKAIAAEVSDAEKAPLAQITFDAHQRACAAIFSFPLCFPFLLTILMPAAVQRASGVPYILERAPIALSRASSSLVMTATL
jgi:hypothetical protein